MKKSPTNDLNIAFEQVNITSLTPRDIDGYDPDMCTYILNHLTIANSLKECASRAPKNFKIIINDNQYILFNRCLLSSVSGTIFKIIQKNPEADSYKLESDDPSCFVQKLGQLLQGVPVIFNKEDKKPVRKIVAELMICKLPNWLRPKEIALLEKSNISFKAPLHSKIAMSKKSFVCFLSQRDLDINLKKSEDAFETSHYDQPSFLQNNFIFDRSSESNLDDLSNIRGPDLDFEIKTKKNTYKCTLIAALSSDIIFSKYQDDHSIRTFFYDYDDENGSFQVMADFLNGSVYELAPNNIELSLKFAKDLEIKPLLNELEKDISIYNLRIANLKANSHIMNDLLFLQDTLLSVTNENINSSYDSIINSVWCNDKEMVRELASNIILISSIVFKNSRPLSKLFKLLVSEQSISKKPSLSFLIKLLLKHFSFLDIHQDEYDYYQRQLCGRFKFESMHFLLMLKEEGVLKSEDIISLWPTINDTFFITKMPNFGNKSSLTSPYLSQKSCLPLIPAYFAPEIKEVFNEFYIGKFGFSQRIRTIFEEEGTIINSIFTDDLDLFVKLTSKKDSDSELEFNFDDFVYAPFEFKLAEIPMIDFSAYCGSAKIFHFLAIEKKATVKFTTLYMAIKGRNEDILKYFTENFVNEQRKSLLEKLNDDYKKWIYSLRFCDSSENKADDESFFANLNVNRSRYIISAYNIKYQSLLSLSVQMHSHSYFGALCRISTKSEIRSVLAKAVECNNFRAFSYIIENICIFNTFKGFEVISERCALHNNTDLLNILFCLFEKDKMIGTSIENPSTLFLNGSIKSGLFYMPSTLISASQTGSIRLTELIKKTAESLPKKKVLPFITAAYNSAVNRNYDLFQYYIDHFNFHPDDTSLVTLLSYLISHDDYEITPIIYNYYIKNGFTNNKNIINYLLKGAAYLDDEQMVKDLIDKILKLDNNASFEEPFAMAAINGNVKLCNHIRTHPINIENVDFIEIVISIVKNEQIDTLKIFLSIIMEGKRGNAVKNGLLYAIKNKKSKSVDFFVTNFLIENEINNDNENISSESESENEYSKNENNDDVNNNENNNNENNNNENNNNENNNNNDNEKVENDENGNDDEIEINGIGVNVHIGSIPMIFVRAAFYGFLNVIKAMVALNHSPSFINAICDEFGSALCAATSSGNEEIVDFLLTLPGIDINIFNSNYETPLIIAAKLHHFSIFTKILKFKPIQTDNYNNSIKKLKKQLNLAFCNFISIFNFNSEYCKFNDEVSSGEKGVKPKVSILPTISLLENCQYENSYLSIKTNKISFYKQIMNKYLIYLLPDVFDRKNINTKDDDQKFIQFFLNCNLIDYGFNSHGCNFLIAAIRSKNYGLVQTLLQKKNTDVNFSDFYGMTALMYAVLNGSFDIIKLMIENGYKSDEINKKVDINKNNFFERTALSFASYTNNFQIVDYIINQPDFNAGKSNLLLSIATAILCDRKKMALYLLNISNSKFNFSLNKKMQLYKESLSMTNFNVSSKYLKSLSEAIINIAVKYGDIDILEALFNHNCFDQTKINRAKILYLSASSIKLNIFKYLLQKFQASTKNENSDGKNELIFDINFEYKGKSLLFASIFTNYLGITEYIISHPDFDPIKSNAITALCKAIIEGSESKVRLITKIKGLDINGKCLNLKKVEKNKSRSSSKMFSFSNEAHVSAGGMTPLSVACLVAPEIVKLLLEIPEIDINSRCEDGSTPIFHCQSTSLEYLLQQRDLDINAQNNSGLTCLMYYSTQTLGKFIAAFLKVGVNLSIKDKEGKTLFDHLGIDVKNMDLSKMDWREKSKLILKAQNIMNF